MVDLLNLRNMPHDGILRSLTARLLSRQTWTALPINTKLLIPSTRSHNTVRKWFAQKHYHQKLYYDKPSKPIHPLLKGKVVRLQTPQRCNNMGTIKDICKECRKIIPGGIRMEGLQNESDTSCPFQKPYHYNIMSTTLQITQEFLHEDEINVFFQTTPVHRWPILTNIKLETIAPAKELGKKALRDSIKQNLETKPKVYPVNCLVIVKHSKETVNSFKVRCFEFHFVPKMWQFVNSIFGYTCFEFELMWNNNAICVVINERLLKKRDVEH